MVAIPQVADPTLALADMAMVTAQARRHRAYLGMSAIGGPCNRALWYGFRWIARPDFDAATLKRFEDGHRGEAVVIDRLRAVETLEIHDTDESGRQFGFTDFGGHFCGHMDFVVLGIAQAPKTWHVGEVKISEKIADLDKAKLAVGEKGALAKWNATYYGQAVLYMDYAGLDRHWTVAASPGVRKWTSTRTDADPAHAMVLKNRAESIIFTDVPPDRIGGPDNFQCRWCDFAPVCHADQAPERNCRSCLNATPERAGGWSCSIDPENPRVLSLKDQERGCGEHRLIPHLVAGEQIDVRAGAIIYRRSDGSEWADTGAGE